MVSALVSHGKVDGSSPAGEDTVTHLSRQELGSTKEFRKERRSVLVFSTSPSSMPTGQ